MDSSTFESPTFDEDELDIFRALVQEILGDKAPKQWQGVAQVEHMARRLPRSLSGAQAAAIRALVACEAIYSASQSDELDAETQTVYDSGVAHANAAEALDRLASHLTIQQATACKRIAGLLRDEANAYATKTHPVKQSNGTPNAPDDLTPWIETPIMAICLGGFLGRGSDVWKGELGDPPNWLQGHMFRRGAQGKRANSWQPVLLIDAVINHSANVKANLALAHKKFKESPHLAPWRAAWDEHAERMYSVV